jgi:hypothetical protein
MNCKNKKCSKELASKQPLSFGNEIARQNDYCSWTCMLENLGGKKAFRFLQNAESKGNTVDRV